jgi:hypothetical protein
MILDIGTLKVSKWPEAQKWMIDNNVVPWDEFDKFDKWDWRFEIEMSEEDAVAFKLKFGL